MKENDIAKTKKYYDELTDGDLCSCAYCRNYMKQVKDAYPSLSDVLKKMGIDIEKPFETWPLEPDESGEIIYLAVQYVVYGNEKEFRPFSVEDVKIDIAESHPMTGILEDHYVIELNELKLKWDL